MTEYELIRAIAGRFARSPGQRNGLFESDAELVEIGGLLWALTLDEFSAEEDLLPAGDPEQLGWNLAVATLTDLLAVGARPQFFMQVLSLPQRVGRDFAEGIADGVRSALDEAGCALCGGDIGVAETWRFTGFAMGPVESTRPITRVLPPVEQRLWVTGDLGDANLAALCGLPSGAIPGRSGAATDGQNVAIPLTLQQPYFELRLDAGAGNRWLGG